MLSIACDFTDNRGPRGSTGKTGAGVTKSDHGKTGASGKNGSAAFEDCSDSIKATFSTVTLLQMVMSLAEEDFLNQRRESAGIKLIWLHNILDAKGDLAPETIDTLMPGSQTQPTAQRESLLQRSRVLLAQLRQGVDYYGHYPNFVPLTSLRIYDETIDEMLPLAEDIENAYKIFEEKKQEDGNKILAIKKAVSSLNLKRDKLGSQKQQLNIEVALTREQITHLLDEQLAFEFRIREGERNFISAVEAQSACGIEDVLKAAGAVATVTSGVGSIMGGIAALKLAKGMIDKSKSFNDWKVTGEYIAKQGGNVASGFNSIAEGYGIIKNSLKTDQDSAKLITIESDFEAELQPYLELTEAREYLRLVRAYLAIVKLRNNKILDVDVKYTRTLEIDSELDALEVDIAATKSRLGQVFNPVLPEHLVFFQRAVARIRADILRAIVMAHHALSYWSLQDVLFPDDLHTRSLDYLKSYHISFKQRVFEAIENRNMAPLKFSTPPIEFNRETHPDEFNTYDETGRFTFQIKNTDPVFLFTARVLVNSATVHVYTRNEMKTPSWIFLQHHGNPVLVDFFGNKHQYTHRRRETRQVLRPGNTVAAFSLGGSDDYAYLSPLASWTFIAEFAGSDGLPLTGALEKERRKNLLSFDISFDGIADSRYADSSPQPTYVVHRNASRV